MADNLFTLGSVVFRAGGVHADGYSRSTEYRHNFTAAIRGEGARNFTGKGGDAITITGSVFPGQYGATNAVDQLRAQARIGTPLQLIDGRGFLIGRYTIVAIDEERVRMLPGGVGRQVDYTIQLRKDPIPINV